MPLLLADTYLQELTLFRTCWIKGRLRGGKTLLAFATAEELVKRQVCRGVISNCPHGLPAHPWKEKVLNERGEEEDLLVRDSVVVYDEPWVDLDNRTSLTNSRTYGAFAGKLRVILLLPSVVPIDKRLSYLRCGRIMRVPVPGIGQLMRLLFWVVGKTERWALGRLVRRLLSPLAWLAEDVWVYKWQVQQGEDVEDSGVFLLTHPSEYFAIYDTAYPSLDDGDIGELWTRTIIQEKHNDYSAGRWWVVEGGGDEQGDSPPGKEERASLNSITGTRDYTRDGGGERSDEAEAEESGIGASPDRNYSPKIRAIAEPFSGRPQVGYLEEDY